MAIGLRIWLHVVIKIEGTNPGNSAKPDVKSIEQCILFPNMTNSRCNTVALAASQAPAMTIGEQAVNGYIGAVCVTTENS